MITQACTNATFRQTSRCKAEDFEKGPDEEAVQKAVQKAFDDLTEKLKAYSDSASMIKKKVVPWLAVNCCNL